MSSTVNEDEVWGEDTHTNKVVVNGNEYTVDGEVTAAKVKQLASGEGIKKFTVEDEDGSILTVDDFPWDGKVVIKEYNAPKSR